MRYRRLTSATGGIITVVVAVVATTALLRVGIAAEEPDADTAGAQLFQEQGCGQCHYVDRTELKIGPGLAGVMKREELPASGRPATGENVRRQLIDPLQAMPSYEERLSEEEIERIIDYLETL